jgi:hypothetical protein
MTQIFMGNFIRVLDKCASFFIRVSLYNYLSICVHHCVCAILLICQTPAYVIRIQYNITQQDESEWKTSVSYETSSLPLSEYTAVFQEGSTLSHLTRFAPPLFLYSLWLLSWSRNSLLELKPNARVHVRRNWNFVLMAFVLMDDVSLQVCRLQFCAHIPSPSCMLLGEMLMNINDRSR